jgi:phenylalanyl-tRNA synthetase beta subunit
LKGDLDALGALAGSFHWSADSSSGNSPQSAPTWPHAARRGTIHLPSTNQNTVIPSEARNLLFSNAAHPTPHSAALGLAGQLTRRVADKFKLRQDVFLAEIHLDPLYSAISAARESRRYEPLPRFPSVERDFSLLLADGTPFSDVVKTIRSLNIAEITAIEAADLFRGKSVPSGKYSLLVRVTFQSREATLTDAQTADFSARMVSALEKHLSAQLRAS